MINGTNAYCKITDISISENIATIKLLIFATKATLPAKSFRICIKDVESEELKFVNNNYYWIDQANNYEFSSNNIDTKKHKEIIFKIDISDNNTGIIKQNRWIKKCYIYLIDSSKDIYSVPSWSSDELYLVSDEFEIPDIEDISFDTVETVQRYDDLGTLGKYGKIKCKFDLKYTSEKDFNYNNTNFLAKLNIRSVSTDVVLETKPIETSSVSLYNEIVTTNSYLLGQRIAVQLLITNKNGEVVRNVRKIYRPTKKYSNTFIKTNKGIKRVIAIYAALDVDSEHEGEWL